MIDKNVNYFLETVKKGSLTKAARFLSISQPALSMGLNSLEKKLGFRLLDRRTSPVSLTEEGKIYLDYVNSLNVLETDFNKQIADSLSKTETKITIGAPLVYAETLLADFIGSGKVDADYTIKVGSQSELEEMLESAQIDCYISTSNDIDPALTKKTIASEKIVLCIPRQMDIAVENYEDLDGKAFVLLENDQPLQKKVDAFFQRYGISPGKTFICNQVSTCVSLALKGKAICFASKEALEVKNITDRFILKDLPDDLFKRDIYIVYDREHYLSKTCMNMIEML